LARRSKCKGSPEPSGVLGFYLRTGFTTEKIAAIFDPDATETVARRSTAGPFIKRRYRTPIL